MTRPRKPSLYQLQAQWDQDRAADRFRPFLEDVRATARRDLVTLPWALVLLAGAVTGLAAVAPTIAQIFA